MCHHFLHPFLPSTFLVHCRRFGWWVVFLEAAAFNADISKWETGQVTTMYQSTSTSVSTLVVHWTVSLICFFICFNSPLLCLLFASLSCQPPFVSILFSTFRVVGSVSWCCCLQCRHFQVGDGAGDEHALQYAHLCSTLFVHWIVSLICFLILNHLSCPLFSTFRVMGSVYSGHV